MKKNGKKPLPMPQIEETEFDRMLGSFRHNGGRKSKLNESALQALFGKITSSLIKLNNNGNEKA